jgi:CRP-like cAMP-binding protein
VSNTNVDALSRALSSAPFLAGAGQHTLDHVAHAARMRRYQRGEFLCRQGEEGRSIFVVVRGGVKLSAFSAEGDESVLATVRAGQAFGEFAALDGGTRSATAVALVDVEAALIDGALLRSSLAADPGLLDATLRALIGLARRATDQRLDLVFLDVASRVAKELLVRATRQGDSFELEIGQTDLASLVGGSRQTINQVLRQLSNEGIVTTHGRKVVVTDIDELRRRATT